MLVDRQAASGQGRQPGKTLSEQTLARNATSMWVQMRQYVNPCTGPAEICSGHDAILTVIRSDRPITAFSLSASMYRSFQSLRQKIFCNLV